eukprot:2055287-Alexandrium_andersonii.AAC.1
MYSAKVGTSGPAHSSVPGMPGPDVGQGDRAVLGAEQAHQHIHSEAHDVFVKDHGGLPDAVVGGEGHQELPGLALASGGRCEVG